jgi:transcriptional regulator with XRE-family HTH domain
MLGRLAAAVHAGDFAATLTLARQRAGLTQREVADRLQNLGLSCSKTSLSAWERGEQAPLRRSSLAVLDELDRMYGLAAGTLCALNNGRPPPVAEFGATMQPPPAASLDGIRTWHLDELLAVGADRRPVAHHTRHLLQATGQPLRCHVRGFDAQHLDDPPQIEPVAGCRIGRTRRRAGRLLVEFLFDDPVAPGDTHQFEYRLSFRPGADPPPEFRRAVRAPTRQLVLQVVFAGERPQQVERTVWPDGDQLVRPRERLHINSAGTALIVVDAPRPGAAHGVRWRWTV